MPRREWAYGQPLVWGTVEEAKKAGFCCICDQPIRQGADQNLVRTGAGRDDWLRAHLQCAWDYPEIFERPAKPPAGVSTQPDEVVDVSVKRTIDTSMNTRGPKHVVLIGDTEVFRSTVQDEAEGVRKAYAHLSEPLLTSIKLFFSGVENIKNAA